MVSSCSETDLAEHRYYKLNEILLSALKCWPFQRAKFANIYYALHFIIIVTHIFVQLALFITSQLTIDLILSVFSYVTVILLVIVQYYALCTKPNEVTQLWGNIRDCWSILKNEMERDIMRQYSSIGELITILLSVTLIACNFVYAFILFSPIILDAIFPLNETRPRKLFIPTEYFVNEQTYYLPIICHWIVGTCLSGFIITSMQTSVLVYVEHICGLLKIASYRIETSIDIYGTHNPTYKDDRIALRNIIAAVDIHKKAVEWGNFLETAFAPTFLALIIITVACLSLNMFRFLKGVISWNIHELFTSISIVVTLFILLFLVNYRGQKITDQNNELFNNVYNTKWYLAPIKVQKLLLFIMQYSTKPYVLSVGFVIASLETFTKISSTSISYFTVMYSLM